MITLCSRHILLALKSSHTLSIVVVSRNKNGNSQPGIPILSQDRNAFGSIKYCGEKHGIWYTANMQISPTRHFLNHLLLPSHYKVTDTSSSVIMTIVSLKNSSPADNSKYGTFCTCLELVYKIIVYALSLTPFMFSVFEARMKLFR